MNEIDPTQAKTVTLHRVAALIGASPATVSRLRSGDRQPSFVLMAHIEKVLHWPIEQQAISRRGNRWNLDFESILQEHFAPKEEQ